MLTNHNILSVTSLADLNAHMVAPQYTQYLFVLNKVVKKYL